MGHRFSMRQSEAVGPPILLRNISSRFADSNEDLLASEDIPDDLPPLEALPYSHGACAVCFEEGEMLRLNCGHTYCAECLEGQLFAKWSGPRVTFNYLNCALCRAPLAHESVEKLLGVHRDLQNRVLKTAVRRFRDDGLVEQLHSELGVVPTEEEVELRAEVDMAVYMCCDCKNPYCAGRVDCAGLDEADTRPTRCPGCEWASCAVANDRRCMLHGHRYAMFKCDSCCAVAVWNCYSNHYCERCHNQASEPKHYPCPGPDLCPLGIPHPPNVEAVHGHDIASFCIGCTACLGCTEAQDTDFNVRNVFGFDVQRDWLKFKDSQDMLMVVGTEEVRFRLKAWRPELSADLSAEECAAMLLPIQRDQQALRERQLSEEQEKRDREHAAQLAVARALEDLIVLELRADHPPDDCRQLKAMREASIALHKVKRQPQLAKYEEERIVFPRKRLGGLRSNKPMRNVGHRAMLSQRRGGRHKIAILSLLDPSYAPDDDNTC